MATVAQPSKLREKFFEYLFDDQTGYLCIATADKTQDPKAMRASFKQTFFKWPSDKDTVSDFITGKVPHAHIWYSVSLFARPDRKKEYANAGRIIYADLDACDPSIVEPHPTLVTETSSGRYQGIWRTDRILDPDTTEDYARRIAYRYSVNGVDKSGWDTGQLLRVPYTRNYKYPGNPEIRIIESVDDLLSPDVFESIDIPEYDPSLNGDQDATMPELDKLPDAEFVIYKYENELKRKPLTQFYIEPDAGADWSSLMWSLINTCFEAGMSDVEVFAIALKAKCNKYERDRRPIRYLWKEVQKAAAAQKAFNVTFDKFGKLEFPNIQPEPATGSFAETYINWATDTTDAPPIFHELSAFMVLSSLLSSNIRLELTFGSIVPNLWGMILGKTTLARKSTAMQLATEMILSLDEEAILATDGSIEGIVQGLSERPGRASIYFRDEVTGFFDQVNKKDYLAGMIEAFTYLYDSPLRFRRVLRKETVHIERPIFIFFGGGIKEKVYSVVTEEYIFSGFLPRFLVVAGESSLEELHDAKKRMDEDMNKRKVVKDQLAQAYDRYNQIRMVNIAGQQIARQPEFEADITDEALDLWNKWQREIRKVAYDSHVSQNALPVFERLTISMLKMAMLLGAVRQEPTNDKFLIEEKDIRNAGHFVQRWAKHSVDMIYDVGKSGETRLLERIVAYIARNPGAPRSNVMRAFHLNKRSVDLFEDTLVERGEIRRQKSGKGVRYWTT